MKKRKRMTLGAIAAVLVCTAGAYQTYSYFMEKEEVTNVFTVGDLEIGLKESEWNPAQGDGINMYPGYTVYKNPTVKNLSEPGAGAQPCYLQIRMKIQDEDGNAITDPSALDLIRKTIRYDHTYSGSFMAVGSAEGLQQSRIPGYSEEDMSDFPMINTAFQEVDTSAAGEYLFQYQGEENGILDAEEETILFTNIVIPTDWGKTQMEKVGNFQIVVTAEAIQANGFASAQDALQELGESIGEGV